MKFANPEAFLLLILVGIVAIFTWKIGVRRRSRIFYPTDNWISRRPRFTIPSPFKVHYFLRLIALILIVIALARPQHVHQRENRLVEAVDIVICFDLSKSMYAVDFHPNRHTVAINTMAKFVDSRADDRIGLVLFSGEAYLAVPLTHDHKVLKKAILESNEKGLQDGTAIGQSLAVGQLPIPGLPRLFWEPACWS